MSKSVALRPAWLLTAIPLSTLAAVPGWAQSVNSQSDHPRIVLAERLHFEHRAAESFEVLEKLVEAEPHNYEALWKTAREAVVMGLLAHGTEIENYWFKRAEDYPARCVEIVPDGIDGLYWLTSAKGLRAVQSPPLDASVLGTDVYTLAHQILEMDSLHAGAHHALGVLNYEVQKLSRLERFIATRLLGNRVFRLTSWDGSEAYLKRAIELEPNLIVYHFDLGKMYLERDKLTLAREEFQHVLDLPVVHPPDSMFHEVAARLRQRTF